MKEEKPPIFGYLDLQSSELNASGPKRGSYTNKYTCNLLLPTGGKCCGKVTLYASGDGKAEQTSNAWTHFRQKVEGGCLIHQEVLNKLQRQLLR